MFKQIMLFILFVVPSNVLCSDTFGITFETTGDHALLFHKGVELTIFTDDAAKMDKEFTEVFAKLGFSERMQVILTRNIKGDIDLRTFNWKYLFEDYGDFLPVADLELMTKKEILSQLEEQRQKYIDSTKTYRITQLSETIKLPIALGNYFKIQGTVQSLDSQNNVEFRVAGTLDAIKIQPGANYIISYIGGDRTCPKHKGKNNGTVCVLEVPLER